MVDWLLAQAELKFRSHFPKTRDLGLNILITRVALRKIEAIRIINCSPHNDKFTLEIAY